MFETDASKAGLWFSANGGNAGVITRNPSLADCDLIGVTLPPAPPTT